MTLDNYIAAVTTPRSLESIQTSLQIATLVSVACVLIAIFLAFTAHKTRRTGRRLAEEIGTLPVAFPPLVLSMAMLITFLSIPGMAVFYNSVFLLVVVLIVIFLPFALRVVGSAIISIDNQLIEASASSGASTLRTFWSIVLPIMTTALVGAVGIVFVFSFRELGGVALVTPPSMRLLPTTIYTYWQTGTPGAVYALNVISFLFATAVLAVTLGFVSLSSRGLRRRQLDLFK